MNDDERKALWGGGRPRGRCAYCGRPVRGLSDARKEGKRWFCSQGHLFSYRGDLRDGTSRKPLRTLRKIVTWTLIVFGLLFVALVIAALAGVGEQADNTAKPGRKAARSAAVGKPVVLHGISYRITRVRKARQVEYAKAQGIFVVVDISVKNVGDEPADIFTQSSLLGGNGKTYSLAGRASDIALAFDLQPEFSKRGRLAFDVGPAAVRGARLRIENCKVDLTQDTLRGDCDSATIDLGLS